MRRYMLPFVNIGLPSVNTSRQRIGARDADLGETTNLADHHPDVAAELTRDAEGWREDIERRWEHEWDPQRQGLTGHHS